MIGKHGCWSLAHGAFGLHEQHNVRGLLMDVVYRYDPFEAITRQNLTGTDEAVAYLERGHNRYSNIVRQVHREVMGGPRQSKS